MSKLIVVVGATGTQGGSVVNAFLNEPGYRIRGITRNPNSDRAKTLAAQGVEVGIADLNDEASLVAAFKGAHVVYAVTDFFEPFMKSGVEEAKKIEYRQAINLVEAAKQIPTLEQYVWSTLPNCGTVSGGRFHVPFFDVKSTVDDYIRKDERFLAKTVFFYLGFFSSNMFYPVYIPIHVKTAQKYIQLLPATADTQIASLGDAAVNTGIFIRGIIKNPPREGGSYVLARVESHTLAEHLSIWGAATGLAKEKQSTEVVPVSLDSYRSIWPGYGDLLGEMMAFWSDAGDRAWTTPLGKPPIDGLVLLSEADKRSLLGTFDSFKAEAVKFRDAV
ncbi:hypothetical protein ARAM_005303 [Aspergillus rambellii]|uniref:NmrA-like domain-containing protein n=1 Tax=Aspergillus rambellii TaxID=308745 RepID=A0A0F8XB57_9EURO|nr:hypothetical protein ARAM_005303 [Aspergillus rambellii]